jgi:hypothetical protein
VVRRSRHGGSCDQSADRPAFLRHDHCRLPPHRIGGRRLVLEESVGEQAHIRLVKEVFAAGRALIDQPSVYGAAHFFTGDVKTSDV